MKIIKHVLPLLLFLCMACRQRSASEELTEIITAYEATDVYDVEIHESVESTILHYASEAEIAENLKSQLEAISLEELTDTEQISAELLAFVLQDKIDAHRFKMYLNPITNQSAFHLSRSDMAKEVFEKKEDVYRYLEQLAEIPNHVEYNLELMRKGIEVGVSQPKEIVRKYAQTYDKYNVSSSVKSVFFEPFLKLPTSLSETFKDSVISVAKASVQKNVINQYRRIKAFFENEYFPNTRSSVSVSEATNGKDLYQNRINFFTTSTEYTAADIHEIGVQEVARITLEMNKIIQNLNFEGSILDFFEFLRTSPKFYAKTENELLQCARDISRKIDVELPNFFKTLPRQSYEVVSVPAQIAPNFPSGEYIESLSDKTPSFYRVNTYDLPSRPLYTIPALTAHEAVPGHHLQISLTNELPNTIPEFRKALYLPAYIEGWGLYAESLAEEMGIYTTLYEKFGKLMYEMLRACRLVVDTGIHAFGWTREEVINYLITNTGLSLHEVRTETDRYISQPGQALSYKIGELRIQHLRKEAEMALGNTFDIREFHEMILGEGILTLAILDRRARAYIQANMLE